MALVLLGTACPAKPQEPADGRALRERRDRALCEQLRAVGSDVSKPHHLEHTFFASDPEHANAAAGDAAKLGLEVSHVTFGGDEPLPYTFTVFSDTIPEAERVSAVTAKMAAIAAAHDVVYDGWGAAIIPKS